MKSTATQISIGSQFFSYSFFSGCSDFPFSFKNNFPNNKFELDKVFLTARVALDARY